MAQILTCRECEAGIIVPDVIPDDMLIRCDECGAEYVSRADPLKAVKKKVAREAKEELHRILKSALRGKRNIKLR